MTLSQIRSIADLRNYAPEIRGHNKYTKIRPTKNFGGIADSRKYAPEIRGHSIGLCIGMHFNRVRFPSQYSHSSYSTTLFK